MHLIFYYHRNYYTLNFSSQMRRKWSFERIIFLCLFDVLNIVYTNGHVACRQLHVNNALNIDFEYEIHRFIGLNYGL